MIGKTISHYKILEKLGEGGMGVVYKAEDTKLRRTVALKFLTPELSRDPEAKKRFLHEAQAASVLDHPSICTVFEADEHEGDAFIAMACLEGQSLKEKIASGPLKIEEATDIALQIAEGLQEAHEKGVTHRDIKPGNVMVTPKGQVKIMDFGLAKVAGRTKLTKTGMTIGTAAYMSPEQARGDETDHRSDIWSLGVVLYELVCGRVPFGADYEQALVYSILNSEPEPLTGLRTGVPKDLERIVKKAMAKSPQERYQHAGDMLVDLRLIQKSLESGALRSQPVTKGKRLGKRAFLYGGVLVVAALVLMGRSYFFQGEDTAIDSIAVLPLENLSGDADQDYFADGMTDELTAKLAQIGALKVISRTSAMRYRGSDKSLPEIARELKVGAIVEGTVMRAGDRVRITAQLIEAAADRHMWAKSYERDLGDVLTLQSEVARAIAGEIRVAITPEEEVRLASTWPVNPEALELYLRGKRHYYTLTEEGMEKSIDYFQKAIAIDPNYAQAYAGLARTYMWLAYFGSLSPEEAYSRCSTLIEKALEIDDALVEAHVALANVKYFLEWNWDRAREQFERAIELNPNFAEGRLDYAWYLMAMGRFEEAIAQAKRALQHDPFSYVGKWTLAGMYYGARRYEQAIATCQEMVELDPNDPRADSWLAAIYEQMGRYEDVVKARQKMMTLSGARSEEVEALDRAYSESGSRGYWMWRLEGLKDQYDRYPIGTAYIYAHLGNKDQAFAWLEEAYEKRDALLYLLKVYPSWDPLRDDPRYDDLVRRMNFPE
jgi:serine/threonine-protein kinase